MSPKKKSQIRSQKQAPRKTGPSTPAKRDVASGSQNVLSGNSKRASKQTISDDLIETRTSEIKGDEKTPLLARGSSQSFGVPASIHNEPMPSTSSAADPSTNTTTSYQGLIIEEKNTGRLLIQSSDSSSAMSTYGTTTETVIEKTLRRLSSLTQLSELGGQIGENKEPPLPTSLKVPSNLSEEENFDKISSHDSKLVINPMLSTRIDSMMEEELNSTALRNKVITMRGDNNKTDQFAKQPLFSNLNISNEFQLITSADMKMNFEAPIIHQSQQQQQHHHDHQQRQLEQNQATFVLDKHKNSRATTDTATGVIRNLPSSYEFHGYQQLHPRSNQERRVMNSFQHFVKPKILGILMILCFVFTTFGNVHAGNANGVAWAAMALILMYILIIFELVHRTLAAIIGASVAVTVYSCLVEIPSIEEVITWINSETLVLLFGMMIIVAVLSDSGIFNCLAIWSYKKAHGRFWLLLGLMYIITAVLSAFVDNVSTMLLMTPIIIRLSELQQMDPRIILMLMIIVSNIGGLATPVGDPPNIIVISDEVMQQQGINFVSFVYICGPAVIIIMFFCFVYMRLRYKNVNQFKHDRPLPVIDNNSKYDEETTSFDKSKLEHEINIWRKVQDYLPSLTRDHSTIRNTIDNQINQLKTCLNKKLYYEEPVCLEGIVQTQYHHGSNLAGQQQQQRNLTNADNYHNYHENVAFAITIKDLESKHPINGAMIIPTLLLVSTIVLFFLQSFPWSHLNSLAWISLFAGIIMLAFNSSNESPSEKQNTDAVGRSEGATTDDHEHSKHGFEGTIAKIEWSTLIFFSALFIVMEVCAKLGLVQYIGQNTIELINLLPMGSARSIGAITIILWVSGIASAIIDNVPFTAMMVKILNTIIMEQQQKQATALSQTNPLEIESLLPIRGMIFALLFGACLGGNGTLIGASANLVTAGVSERFGYPIGFNQFFKFSFPITLISLVISNIYLILVFQYII